MVDWALKIKYIYLSKLVPIAKYGLTVLGKCTGNVTK